VFGADTEIRYTPQFNGFKEDIILNEYTGVNEFTFKIKTNGLSLVKTEDGIYNLIDPLTGEVKAQLGDLVIYDSKPWDIPDVILNKSVNNPTAEDLAEREAIMAEILQQIAADDPSEEILPFYNHRYVVETIS
jgi:hypothetical protein